jgi:hypothetical protein
MTTVIVDRVKYLEMIQAVVSRMSGHSFLVRGWAVTLVSALLAVSAREQQVRFALLALVATAAFWGLDAFYLGHERLFRGLFNRVRKATDAELSREPYSLSTGGLSAKLFLDAGLSLAVILVHGVLLLSIVAVVFMALRIRMLP